MADLKITQLPVITSPASNDVLPIVNIAGDTTSQITYANLTSTFATLPINLTSGVTGTLPVANGGTGLATLTSGSVLVGNGTGAVTLVTTTGSSSFVRATSPTLVTPVLGAATATSINGLTLTSSTGVITITNAKTLAVTNTLTLSGTDSTVMTFPSTTQTIAGLTSSQTITNKRITRRLTTTNAPGATPTTNTDNVDIMNFTGLGTAITSMTSSLSGTPVDGDLVEFRFTDDGTARGITWGASFGSTTVTLPTTTVISTMLRVVVEWNGSIWQAVGVA